MGRLMLTSDLHLGHRSICKYRKQFNSMEEHNEIIFDNLASNVNKRDTLYLLGDIAFDRHWLDKVKSINVRHKCLIVGNHDTERGISMVDLCDAFDSVVAFKTHRNYWLSHCPIHPQEMRGRKGNIHGHLHGNVVEREYTGNGQYSSTVTDWRYLNACVEHTDYKPISWEDLISRQYK